MTAPPEWLTRLSEHLLGAVIPSDVLAPVGCHYTCVDSIWEVTLFPGATEVVGGAMDGKRCTSRFTLDLATVHGLMSEIGDFYWQTLPYDRNDELGPHVAIAGKYEDHQVWVRILARAPQRFTPGRTADPYGNRWNDVW